MADLLPTNIMARRAGVPAKWLREEAEAGRVPSLRAGCRLLFNEDVVTKRLLERAASDGAREEAADELRRVPRPEREPERGDTDGR